MKWYVVNTLGNFVEFESYSWEECNKFINDECTPESVCFGEHAITNEQKYDENTGRLYCDCDDNF